MKIVCGKIFSSLEVSDKSFLTKYFKVKRFVLLLMNLMQIIHNNAHAALKCILHKHRHITTFKYNCR